ncbi:MAG TPA: class I adenylate-forming enzyme family protein [Methanocorpusculum sp.]|nr:class I adenylate-forming enzyme family protein [Methanocorpusculum sp.]
MSSKNIPLNYTENEKRSLFQALLYGYCRAGDDSIAVAYFDRHIHWKQFMEEIDAAAAAFLKHGVKKGDCITIYTPNIPQATVALYAANRLGAVANMIHPLSPKQEIEHAVTLTSSKIVFTVEINEENVSGLDVEIIRCKTGTYFGGIKAPVLRAGYAFVMRKYGKAANVRGITEWGAFLKEGRDALAKGLVLPEENGHAKDTAVIMYTGGTTGVSKGVMLSNYAVNSISMQMLIDVGLGKTDVEDGFLAILPIFHAFGLAVTIHAPLISGMKVVLVPRFDPKGCFEQIKREHVVFLPGVPALFERMYPYFENYYLGDLKLMVSGGDRVAFELMDKYNKLLKRDGADIKFRAGYGLTEACGTCTLSPNDYIFLPSGCIGVPMTGSEVCIVEPDTTNVLPDGEEGELCYYGPAMMTGYYNNQEATDAVMIKHPDGKVWLHTGDIVVREKDGNICFRSRSKRMVKINGFNVYPFIIEEEIQHHPAVKQVCAVAMPYKQDKKIKLFVTLNEGYSAETIEEQLIAFSKDKLNHWSTPVKVEVISEMPMTKFNKIDYRLLQDREMEGATLVKE